ncbi:MAG: ATP-binding cassette domain-containing protein [Pseudomonadota bacterium]
MIRIADASFGYGSAGFRLRIPSLVVESGERVAVVGPSGSGKTTLLNLIAGITAPESGTVEVDGVNVGAQSDAARRAYRARTIGFVFQNFALMDYLSGLENILYPYRVAPSLTLNRAARDRARALADACGIGEKIRRKPAALSQGEQQRVAICRALVTEPKLILADEATGNLDPAAKASIIDVLFARAEEAGSTVLAVTHDHELLPRFDRVIDFADFRASAE